MHSIRCVALTGKRRWVATNTSPSASRWPGTTDRTLTWQPRQSLSSCRSSVRPLPFRGLFWQFTLYRLSGARLRVQTVLEFHNEYGHVQTVTGTRRMTWDDFIAGHPGEPTRLGIEVVRVRVTNVGRSPVSVDNIAPTSGAPHACGAGAARSCRGRSGISTPGAGVEQAYVGTHQARSGVYHVAGLPPMATGRISR